MFAMIKIIIKHQTYYLYGPATVAACTSQVRIFASCAAPAGCRVPVVRPRFRRRHRRWWMGPGSWWGQGGHGCGRGHSRTQGWGGGGGGREARRGTGARPRPSLIPSASASLGRALVVVKMGEEEEVEDEEKRLQLCPYWTPHRRGYDPPRPQCTVCSYPQEDTVAVRVLNRLFKTFT